MATITPLEAAFDPSTNTIRLDHFMPLNLRDVQMDVRVGPGEHVFKTSRSALVTHSEGFLDDTRISTNSAGIPSGVYTMHDEDPREIKALLEYVHNPSCSAAMLQRLADSYHGAINPIELPDSATDASLLRDVQTVNNIRSPSSWRCDAEARLGLLPEEKLVRDYHYALNDDDVMPNLSDTSLASPFMQRLDFYTKILPLAIYFRFPRLREDCEARLIGLMRHLYKSADDTDDIYGIRVVEAMLLRVAKFCDPPAEGFTDYRREAVFNARKQVMNEYRGFFGDPDIAGDYEMAMEIRQLMEQHGVEVDFLQYIDPEMDEDESDNDDDDDAAPQPSVAQAHGAQPTEVLVNGIIHDHDSETEVED